LSRHWTEARLTSTANVIAAAIASPLEIGAGSEIEAVLESLSATQDIAYAAVWRPDGSGAGASGADHLTTGMPNTNAVPLVAVGDSDTRVDYPIKGPHGL